MRNGYSEHAPTRAEVDAIEGATVLDFGTDQCGHCRAAQPIIAGALEQHPQVRHIKIRDGKHRSLGRSYRVKLWPTLIFLKDGREVARLVRPRDVASVTDAIEKLGNAS